jgi:hypothetical protein
LTDHQLDVVAKESAGEYGVLNFAGSLKKVPGDLISISTDVECSAMIAKRSEAASVPGRLCDIAA